MAVPARLRYKTSDLPKTFPRHVNRARSGSASVPEEMRSPRLLRSGSWTPWRPACSTWTPPATGGHAAECHPAVPWQPRGSIGTPRARVPAADQHNHEWLHDTNAVLSTTDRIEQVGIEEPPSVGARGTVFTRRWPSGQPVERSCASSSVSAPPKRCTFRPGRTKRNAPPLTDPANGLVFPISTPRRSGVRISDQPDHARAHDLP